LCAGHTYAGAARADLVTDVPGCGDEHTKRPCAPVSVTSTGPGGERGRRRDGGWCGRRSAACGSVVAGAWERRLHRVRRCAAACLGWVRVRASLGVA